MDILVIEDESSTRKLLCDFIQSLGHTVWSAESGEAAMRVFSEVPIALVVLDWVLPDSSGILLCQEFRKKKNLIQCYIIFVTSKTEASDLQDAFNAGANDFVEKPIKWTELKARLNNGVQLIELQKQIQELKELLPICAWCKKVRKDDGYLQSLEHYIVENSKFVLSHGICEECKEQARLKS